MNPIVFAMRRPYTVMVGVLAVAIGAGFAASRSRVDVFPPLNQPVLYVCQPYGGMNPQQMEGLIANYHEFHFLYVNGIHHVESRNIQGMTLLKLYFHPGTDMAQAMAETVAAVNRARFMMPPNTVPPFVTRLDTGSAAVGYLVLSSETKSIKDIQDTATLKVRPMFASVPGVSSPPAFGGNQRAITVSIDPDKLRSQQITLEQLTEAVGSGNVVSPSGNLRVGDRTFLVNANAMVGGNPKEELGKIAVKTGDHPVFLKDVATVDDASDITAGYVLVNGKRSVYMLVTKRAETSTVTVVDDLKAAMPRMREAAPGIEIEFAFDQSPLVVNSMIGVGFEGALGAVLTGLMVLLFLRDWRSVIVVVLNIPLALLAAVLALWISGVTINLMSLGGMALAVGILVDESTVEVENIHTQMEKSDNVARAVRRGNAETAVPRLLAMLCVLAVFIPSFFMRGAARELFVPLALAVGFAMIASYLLSSTFVPVMCVYLLKLPKQSHNEMPHVTFFQRFSRGYEILLARLLSLRWFVAPSYFLATALILLHISTLVGTAIFPPTDQGQFVLRMKAPTGTRIERTEELAREAIRLIEAEAGAGKVQMTVGYVGMFPTNYPIQAVHQWTSGPEEMLLKVALTPNSGIRIAEFKAKLRDKLAADLRIWLKQKWAEEGVSEDQRELRAAGLRLSFEPGDLINEVMSFGAPTAVEVQVSGSKPSENLELAKHLFTRMKAIPDLRDLQLNPAQDYPTIDIDINREKLAVAGLTTRTVAGSLIPATASSRYMTPIYWRDPGSGQAYIVQIQVPPSRMTSGLEIGLIPVRGAGWGVNENGHAFGSEMTGGTAAGGVLLRDVANIKETTTPAEILRYNMRRTISVTANVGTDDLGLIGREVRRAVADVRRVAFLAEYRKKLVELKVPPDAIDRAVKPEETAAIAGTLTDAGKGQCKVDRAAVLSAVPPETLAQLEADLATSGTAPVPGGRSVDLRGQIVALDDIIRNLAIGLAIAVLAIFLLLTAYFQSIRLSLIAVSAVPATLCGVGLALFLTGTTLNLQSFMGAIMAVGVAVANAILLVTFAERNRTTHGMATRAAVEGGLGRLRAILMTSGAMAVGMIPMALGYGEGGDLSAPLGRAVLGGVIASTFATLLILPTLFALAMRMATVAAPSLDPDDPGSLHHDIGEVKLFDE